MRIVPAVLLRHETRGGGHYDFMLAPRNDGELVTWRVMRPTWHWTPGMRVDFRSLPPHRRAYLRREGAVSRGRGWAWRADEGVAAVQFWAEGRMVVDLRMRRFRGRMELRRLSASRWVGTQSRAGFILP